MAKEKAIKSGQIKTYFLGSTTDRTLLFLVYTSIVTALLYNTGLPGIYLFILIYLLLSKKTFFRFKRAYQNPFVVLTSSLFLLQLIGLTYTQNMPTAWMKIEGKMPFLVLPLFLFSIQKSFWKKNFNRIINFFIATTFGTTLLMFAKALFMMATTGRLYSLSKTGAPSTYYFMYTELSGWIAHPGYVTLYLGLAVFMLLNKVLKSKRHKWQHAALIALFLITMFLLQGRGSLLAFALITAIGLLFFSLNQKKYTLLFWLLAPAIALVLFIGFAPQKMTKRFTDPLHFEYDISWPDKDQFNGVTIRLAEWECATDAIARNFWVGTGTGDAQDALNESYIRNNFLVGQEHQYNCHNQFLEAWLVNGILGFALVLSMAIYISFIALKNGNYLLLAALWLVYLGMLTESVLERQMGMYLFLFFCSFFQLAFVHHKKSKEKTK